MIGKKFRWLLFGTMVLATGSMVTLWGGNLIGQMGSLAHAEVATAKPAAEIPPATVAAASELSKAFRSVHDALKNAVVNIDISRKIPAGNVGRNRLPEDLRRMLPPELIPDEQEEPVVPTPAPSPNAKKKPDLLVPAGTGSGVIVRAEGYILTNNHVVDGADAISVKLSDGRDVKATVVGTDPKTDLAVIKIDADNLTYARLGDSDSMDVGDWVLAFGSPFSFDQTMTQGIISAKGRQIDIIREHNPALQGLTYENFLQTDAAINPGNSGGPLVNLKGEIIGINTAIASRTGGYNGIGFAIPSNDAKSIMESLIKNGKVIRGYMGVGIVDARDSKAKPTINSLGYTGDTGVLVSEVRRDGPAGQGGLQLDDIITALNGKKVESMTQLRNDIARTAPGTRITLTVFRAGKTLEVSFAVGTQPDNMIAKSKIVERNGMAEYQWDELGMSVAESPKGLTIKSISRDGWVVGRGLSVGDVIYKVQGQEVKTVAELEAAVSKGSLSKGIRIQVHSVEGSDRSFFFIAD